MELSSKRVGHFIQHAGWDTKAKRFCLVILGYYGVFFFWWGIGVVRKSNILA